MLTAKEVERFWNLVDVKSDAECWNWTGHKTPCGYGNFKIHSRIFNAHRISFIIANGSIENGKHVLHKCDNPACVNPKHLFSGTHRDNMIDMSAKNRNNSGALSKKDVIEIRRLLSSGKDKGEIAKTFKVSERMIQKIFKNQHWKNVF